MSVSVFVCVCVMSVSVFVCTCVSVCKLHTSGVLFVEIIMVV